MSLIHVLVFGISSMASPASSCTLVRLPEVINELEQPLHPRNRNRVTDYIPSGLQADIDRIM